MSEFSYVEKPFLHYLEHLGWDIRIFEDDSVRYVPKLTFRSNFDEVLLEGRLRTSIKKLNDWLDFEQVEEAIQEIKRIGLRKGLKKANMDFLSLLFEPPAFIDHNKPHEKSKSIKIIDFKEPLENDFLALNQFRVNTPGTLRNYIIPDIVLFVNGLPLAVIECKYPSKTAVEAMEDGITQIKRYSNTRDDTKEKEGNERLFWYNQILISTTKDEARMGTITSEYDHYLEWKDTYPLPLEEKLNSQEKMILGALNKKNLLDLVRNFTLFQETEKGPIKIVARYHQYRAVNKIFDRLLNEKDPKKRSGVIWHTQGSGKSLSMVFLIKKIRTNETLRKYKAVAITDRVALERQLKTTMGIAETPYEVKNTKELISELKTDTSNLVMVIAHKFLKRGKKRTIEDALPEYEDFQILNTSKNILVLVDEAHRTQSGTFGDNIVYSLPNSTRIAFTGTPLISKKVKKKTYVRFGDYIDKYRMKESIEDGSTLRIKYEGKTVNTKISSKKQLDSEFEDMFTNKTKEEIEAIKKKYGTKGNVLEAKKRISSISKDIVKHYFENIFDNGFKAQIVASSRLAAYRYKLAIDEALSEYIANYEKGFDVDPDRLEKMKFLKSVVRISWLNNDIPEIIRLAKQAKTTLGYDNVNFKSKIDIKKPNTGISFLIVKDMLLTGFDAPIEQVMYIDKKMTDHSLLQAIARVNRVTKTKDVGYVVDYYGITNHLTEALDAYSDDDLQLDEVFTNVSTEIPLLKYRYEQLVKLFEDNGVAGIENYVQYRVKQIDEQLTILEKCLEVLEDIKIRDEFSVKFKLFLKSMEILLSYPAGRKYILAMKAFGHIQNRAQHRFRDNSINILGAGAKVRELIDKHLLSLGIDTKIEPIEITSEKFETEVNKNRSPRSQASEMEHAIRKHCKVRMNKDPLYYRKISEKLEDILAHFSENWEEQARHLLMLTHEIQQGRNVEETGLDPVKYAPFYDLILDIAYHEKKIPEEQEEQLQKMTINSVDIIESEVSKVGFWGNAYKQRTLRSMLDDILLYSGIEQIYETKGKIVSELVKLAKHRFEGTE
jgi:type I restriction enzyme, R subunit